MICLDSSLLIDFFRGRAGAVKKVSTVRDMAIAVTSITVFEVMYGFYRKNMHKKAATAMKFFSSLKVLDTNLEAADKSARIAAELSLKGQTINEFDSLIAGTMLTDGYTAIITSNRKDFRKIKELRILQP